MADVTVCANNQNRRSGCLQPDKIVGRCSDALSLSKGGATRHHVEKATLRQAQGNLLSKQNGPPLLKRRADMVSSQ